MNTQITDSDNTKQVCCSVFEWSTMYPVIQKFGSQILTVSNFEVLSGLVFSLGQGNAIINFDLKEIILCSCLVSSLFLIGLILHAIKQT